MLTLVQTMFAARENEAGERLAEALIEKRKAFPQIYDALYIHYLRANRPELAEEVLQRKISNNPGSSAFVIQLASHYVLVHRPADVLATVARLTSDSKRFPNGRLEAGDFYVRVRDYAAALEQFQAGRQLNPKAARVYRKKIAEVLATQGQRDQARSMVADLLKDDSKDPEARALRATLWLASGDTHQARAALSELQDLTKGAAFQRNSAFQSWPRLHGGDGSAESGIGAGAV